MSTDLSPRAVGVPPAHPVIVPVAGRHGRVIGAYVTNEGSTGFVPAVDVQRLALLGLGAVAVLTAGTVAVARHHQAPAIRQVTMGHGGWISLRNAAVPPLRRAPVQRPWWARLLGARRLVVH